jgi:hypothetical protein
MNDKLVEKARALETALKGAVGTELEKGAYEHAEVLLALVREAGSLAVRLERLGNGAMTPTHQRNMDASGGRGTARFRFTDSDLVMDAPRRTDRTQKYRHQVPLDAVDTILGHMRALGSNGQVFSHGELIDRYGRGNPDYHVYVVTRLLRDIGLIERHRRGAYSVERAALDGLSVEALRRRVG